MPDVEVVMPGSGVVDANSLVDTLLQAQLELEPFHDGVVDFAADLSRRLRKHPDVRTFPAISALAYWIRPASVTRLRQDWQRLCDLEDRAVRVPRGLAFHIPPTNVDTLFIYSWLLSALVGNANVIRLSADAVEAGGPLLDTLAEVLLDHPTMGSTTAIVTYGHEAAVTGALSRADVRVIWGGDDTVRAIRAIPPAPRTFELAFPDRYSMAALDADAVNQLDEAGMKRLAQAFFNDAFWFDQLGCASPRLIVWRGSTSAGAKASHRFSSALSTELGKSQHPPPSTSAVVAKLVHVADTAATGAVSSADWSANSVTRATLTDLAELRRDSPGGGLFYEVTVGELEDLVGHIQRRDQTLTHFGFSMEELKSLAEKLGARGLDRMVPVGEALSFDRLWDGHDLLVAFTRNIVVTPSISPDS